MDIDIKLINRFVWTYRTPQLDKLHHNSIEPLHILHQSRWACTYSSALGIEALLLHCIVLTNHSNARLFHRLRLESRFISLHTLKIWLEWKIYLHVNSGGHFTGVHTHCLSRQWGSLDIQRSSGWLQLGLSPVHSVTLSSLHVPSFTSP